ncbi:unnamed protein product [Toxocara canis]|nr:unnamed protein product [Toxocara canis]
MVALPGKEAYDDPLCNSLQLKEIMLQSITDDITESRRHIKKAAEEKLKEKLNVICAKGQYTYFAYTEFFCQAAKDDVSCYAFKPL